LTVDENCSRVLRFCLFVQKREPTLDPITDIFRTMHVTAFGQHRLEATIQFKSRIVGGLLVAGLACFGQLPKPSRVGLLTPDEYRKAGLDKLTGQEIQSLDSALIRVFVALGVAGRSDTLAPGTTSASDSEFFDSRGAAVAYFDDDETLYLWSGEPVAYRDEDSLYGFNGSYVGWLHEGAVYDHDGNIVAAVAGRFRGSVQVAPLKSLKELKPLKGLKS